MCTVHEALTARKWVSDIQGALTVGVILEFLHLWEILSNFVLQPEENDTHFWKTWVSPKCCFFLWLATQRKCWMADRLARRGLTHPDRCPPV
jgi:hypothetical protein